jgi:hypothetical protein
LFFGGGGPPPKKLPLLPFAREIPFECPYCILKPNLRFHIPQFSQKNN